MRRLRPVVAALCLATMGLTACGQESPEATPEPAISSPAPSAPPTAKQSRDPLADAVEDLAKTLTPSADATTASPAPAVSPTAACEASRLHDPPICPDHDRNNLPLGTIDS